MEKLTRRWEAYWFQPAPLISLAFCRVIVVAFQLYYLIANDYLSQITFPDSLYRPLTIFRFLTLPLGWNGFDSLFHMHVEWLYHPDGVVLEGFYWITLVAGFFALVGFRTNLSLIIFAVGNIFMQAFHYSFGDLHHPEGLIMITLCIFALSPVGRVLSIDDLYRRVHSNRTRKKFEEFDPLDGTLNLFARWPLLLTQWMFALIYLSGCVSKLFNSGLDWITNS